MNKYDVIIIGAGPGGIFAAYELMQKAPRLKVAVYESGNPLEKRKCPIDGKKVKSCINCKTCAIMSGFGGAGAFSDGKYNITNDFGGTLYEYIGKDTAISLMHYVDEINVRYGGEGTKMYSTAGTKFKKLCMQNKLKLLDASVRHLGTDINYVVLENIFKELKEKVAFHFNCRVDSLEKIEKGYRVTSAGDTAECEKCIVSVGRSGSKWMEYGLNAAEAGNYTFQFRYKAHKLIAPKVEFFIDGESKGEFEWPSAEGEWSNFEIEIPLKQGNQRLRIQGQRHGGNVACGRKRQHKHGTPSIQNNKRKAQRKGHLRQAHGRIKTRAHEQQDGNGMDDQRTGIPERTSKKCFRLPVKEIRSIIQRK